MGENVESTGNKNVDMILGDYKNAMRKMAIPMIISMLVTTSYTLVDAIWTSVLGANPLAAVGFVNPIFMIVMGIGNGLAAGATSLIARKIGGKNKKGADEAATQSIIVSIIIAIILTLVILIFQKPILIGLGASGVINLAMGYSTYLFAGTIFIILSSVFAGVLRAEGDVNRSLYAMIITAVLNIVLDPIFMLYLNMGVIGNAIATVISAFIATFVIFYWLFIKSDTYVKIKRDYIKPNFKVMKDMLWVGIPSSLEMVCTSILLIITNTVLILVANTNAVAVYTAGIRVVLFGIVPSIGLSVATITVAGAAFGAGDYEKLRNVLMYSLKIGLILSLIVGVVIFIFSDYFALLFSFSANTAPLIGDISALFKVMFLFFLATPFGLISGSFFQSLGKGPLSLGFTFVRELIFTTIFILLFAFVFNFGQYGVWFGMCFGKLIGALIGCAYSIKYSGDLIKKDKKVN